MADTPTPVAYINDITVSESRGWNQLKIALASQLLKHLQLIIDLQVEMLLQMKIIGGGQIKLVIDRLRLLKGRALQ